MLIRLSKGGVAVVLGQQRHGFCSFKLCEGGVSLDFFQANKKVYVLNRLSIRGIAYGPVQSSPDAPPDGIDVVFAKPSKVSVAKVPFQSSELLA